MGSEMCIRDRVHCETRWTIQHEERDLEQRISAPGQANFLADRFHTLRVRHKINADIQLRHLRSLRFAAALVAWSITAVTVRPAFVMKFFFLTSTLRPAISPVAPTWRAPTFVTASPSTS